MLKFRSDSCLSRQNKSAYKFKIIIGIGHENAWRIWSSLNEHMRWWYIHKIQNQCIGFFLKPNILIMKDWQVYTCTIFFILINRVLYIFFLNFCFDLNILIFSIKANMYFIVSCLFNLGWILIELMVHQGHEQCGSGPSLSLN
jgi:hypothetical protein